MMRPATKGSIAAVLLLGLLVCLRPQWNGPSTTASPAGQSATAAQVERGDYLVRAGNCVHCHTPRGGAELAGGRAIDTPFGTVYSSNLTPDATGLGGWTADDFWQALHNGKSRDGHWLTPAFPYTSYTAISRADADAMWAWLQSRPAVAQTNRAHDLRWPYNTQLALGVWRALYFKPGAFTPDASHSATWNRGAYLVQTLGHCSACHSQRNGLGASTDESALAGGLIPQQNWYAPSLVDPQQAGVQTWPTGEVVALLHTGVSASAAVTGPMAEVVQHSTQYLSEADLLAMAEYLKSIPVRSVQPGAVAAAATAPAVSASANAATDQPGTAPASVAGEHVYREHCASCHGQAGQGVAKAYPALAGNRAVLLPSSVNLVHMVLRGGFAPATADNPRPFGMPPFALALNDAEVAAVLSYIRSAWGNQAPGVSAAEVDRLRALAKR